jgi:predicted enzyme related to lactoylglutathione lyase
MWAKSKEGGNAMATFADSEGNLFGLCEIAKEQ